MTIRVVVADDQSLVRAGFRVLLERAEGIEVVGEAENGAEAVELARSARPDVILMDIRMPVLDGLAATRKIVADDRAPGVHVIMLTTFELDEYVFEALRAGASGFLLKNIDPDDLRRAVRVVAGGDALLSPSVTKRLIAEFATRPAGTAPDTGRLAVLTGREREVVALVGRGLSNDEIGRHLHMSPATARTHVSRAMTKLDVRDRPQLVVLAYETHLVTPGE
ncbi:MAG TPA: response regulator transcription factor [Actinophytocola sp.]|uniref:response regulator transcription factor n=1 Tax=Actinophytocola sp. TaxID=1872138 RepID=UPI002E0C45E8|nr:response regulator transcription factor [Actinophytocola sp.]